MTMITKIADDNKNNKNNKDNQDDQTVDDNIKKIIL